MLPAALRRLPQVWTASVVEYVAGRKRRHGRFDRLVRNPSDGARVARELHDGVIQALIGAEMKLEAWRRQEDPHGATASKFEYLQRLLRDQVLSLRELIQQVRPPAIEPQQLVPYLAELVEKFQRETGIQAHFSAMTEYAALPPHVASEIARLVQEALMNVRRHSGARQVVVTFGQQNGSWIVKIDDDGRGFRFSGRRSHEELEVMRCGPVAIKERVRAINGALTLSSEPGRGATLEIRIPTGQV